MHPSNMDITLHGLKAILLLMESFICSVGRHVASRNGVTYIYRILLGGKEQIRCCSIIKAKNRTRRTASLATNFSQPWFCVRNTLSGSNNKNRWRKAKKHIHLSRNKTLKRFRVFHLTNEDPEGQGEVVAAAHLLSLDLTPLKIKYKDVDGDFLGIGRSSWVRRLSECMKLLQNTSLV